MTTITTNVFALADVFTAYFTEDELLRLALTCFDLKKALTPEYGFPITHVIKRDINTTIKALMHSHVIPSENTFEFVFEEIQHYYREILACKSVRTHVLTSFAFWKRMNHTNILQMFVCAGLLKVGDAYQYHDVNIENYKLKTHEIRCNTGMETCYSMKPYLSEKQKEAQKEMLSRYQKRRERIYEERITTLLK